MKKMIELALVSQDCNLLGDWLEGSKVLGDGSLLLTLL
jgi:hypothetical protein